MLDLFFSGGAAWFTVPAAIGTSVFLLRLCLLFVGHHVGDVGDVHAGDVHGDPGDAFKVLSIQSIGAFIMGFGWAGLGALKGSGWPIPTALAVGAAGGTAMVWLLAMLLRAVNGLQTSGNIVPEDAVGLEGDVYVTVPPKSGGTGQVRLNVHERQRIMNAVSVGDALPTNTRVRVVQVNDDRTITVAPI